MSDPTRLLAEDSDADALERGLLTSLESAEPSAEDKAAIWQSVSAGMVAAGIVAASSGAAASSAAAGASSALPKALLVKVGLIAALGGVGAGGVALYQLHTVRTPGPTSAVSAPRSAPTPRAPAPSLESAPETRAPEPTASASTPASTSAHKKPRAPDQLARESALLMKARAALRGGDEALCQATLAELARSYPRGVLVQEREVLEIELLLARSETAQARARVASFAAKYPESPHRERLERLVR